MKNSVCITGIGVVSPIGNSAYDVYKSALQCKSGLKLYTNHESNHVPTILGRSNFCPEQWFTKMQLSGLDRVSQFAVAAARMACDDSQIKSIPNDRTGCYLGTGMGGATSLEDGFQSHFSENPRLSPLTVIASMNNAATAHIAMHFQIYGPALTYSIACASSSVAIGEAYRAIAAGAIDFAFAGGSESLLAPGVIRAWQAMRTLARPDLEKPETSSRPFSADRTGLVLSEGATILFLENTERAKTRGAKIYCEIVGYGLSCDASHIAKPDLNGQKRSLKAALQEAQIQPQDVGYINAHGTATKVGDLTECRAIEEVWEDQYADLTVSSTKALHGHLLGATGALETAITAMTLKEKIIPPTAFCTQLDPEIKIPILLDQAKENSNLKYALNSSFAFGGTNAVLAMKSI